MERLAGFLDEIWRLDKLTEFLDEIGRLEKLTEFMEAGERSCRRESGGREVIWRASIFFCFSLPRLSPLLPLAPLLLCSSLSRLSAPPSRATPSAPTSRGAPVICTSAFSSAAALPAAMLCSVAAPPSSYFPCGCLKLAFGNSDIG